MSDANRKLPPETYVERLQGYIVEMQREIDELKAKVKELEDGYRYT